MLLASSFASLGCTRSVMRAIKVQRLRWAVPPAAFALVWWAGGGMSNRQHLQFDGPLPWDQKSPLSTVRSQNKCDKGLRVSSNEAIEVKGSQREYDARKDGSAWGKFTRKFDTAKDSWTSIDWSGIGGSITNFVVPEWARFLPDHIAKLRRELSMAPGSLADDVWKEARDSEVNPEIALDAYVRVSDGLCREELIFRHNRQQQTMKALARYLNLKEEDIHPDDVPIIAICGSGGGLRALVAGTGSYLAAQEAGLWDCVTYTAGVSGSCWLQALYNSSVTGQNFHKLLGHLKNRIGVHIAFPLPALYLLTTAPTNKYLLSGLVEKLKGDPDADFGLVDIYGLLLGARLLVPRDELDLSSRDLKLSNQKDYMRNGRNPLPIYTAVRHEIPEVESEHHGRRATENVKETAKREAWFQWLEFTPYEFFCEEFGAGIPTWAVGRHFNNGKNVIADNEYAIPELRIPTLMGIWGSAFCATLSHYYKEIKPVVSGLAGFGGIDSLIEGKNEDLSRVHPIDPASIPNFALGMKGKLPPSAPESVFSATHLRLMDAGMSNNLPVYPLLRPGREVDIVIAFDASADIQRENWLALVDGYAKQRGIKGWPIGAGWPREDTKIRETAERLKETRQLDTEATNKRLETVQNEHSKSACSGSSIDQPSTLDSKKDNSLKPWPSQDNSLTYCNVWLGTKEQLISDKEPPPSKRLFYPTSHDQSESDFSLMQPNAGIAVVYFPFLPNPSAPDISFSSCTESSASVTATKIEAEDPAKQHVPRARSINPNTDDFLSTWNFVYTPQQIDAVVGLARANFAEGEAQVKRVVRGVYERRKRDRLHREAEALKRKQRELEEDTRRKQEGFIPVF